MHGESQIPNSKLQTSSKSQIPTDERRRCLEFGAWSLELGAFFFSIIYLLFSHHASAQLSAPKITKIEIRHVGPPAVSDELIRANIRVKVGDPYLPTAIDDDVRNLYGTGLFYNIKVDRAINGDEAVLT